MTAIQKIIATHVASCTEIDQRDLVFIRLGGFLDNEGPSILSIGSALQDPGIERCLGALGALHRTDEDGDQLTLLAALDLLEDLRHRLLASSTAHVVDGSAGAVFPSDFDASVNYHGARVDDQIAAIRYILGRL